MKRDELRNKLAQSLAADLMPLLKNESCILCNNSNAALMGIWSPSSFMAKFIGEKEGKLRVIAYRICDNCFGISEQETKVEKAILQRMGYSDERIDELLAKSKFRT